MVLSVLNVSFQQMFGWAVAETVHITVCLRVDRNFGSSSREHTEIADFQSSAWNNCILCSVVFQSITAL